jgi:hypothetical protein
MEKLLKYKRKKIFFVIFQLKRGTTREVKQIFILIFLPFSSIHSNIFKAPLRLQEHPLTLLIRKIFRATSLFFFFDTRDDM